MISPYLPQYAERVQSELSALAHTWRRRRRRGGGGGSGGGSEEEEDDERPGEAAASLVSAKLRELGIAVYSPPPSQSDEPPYACTGPRFYVSVTAAAAEAFGGHDRVPPVPPSLRAALWPHAADAAGVDRIRGLGWTLAPFAE